MIQKSQSILFAIRFSRAAAFGILALAVFVIGIHGGEAEGSGKQAGFPYLALNPQSGTVLLGQTFQVRLDASTHDGVARGGAAGIAFDPTIFEIVGGPAGIQKAPGSPFNLVPTPRIDSSGVEISFLQPEFSQVSYTGTLATFTVRVLRTSPSSGFGFRPGISRFAPDIANTQTFSALYVATSVVDLVRAALLDPAAPPAPDANNDGRVDVADLVLGVVSGR